MEKEQPGLTQDPLPENLQWEKSGEEQRLLRGGAAALISAPFAHALLVQNTDAGLCLPHAGLFLLGRLCGHL
eukprot:1152171-Pelagomonas_calceolata.AAC.4